jgi:hypothetical protein
VTPQSLVHVKATALQTAFTSGRHERKYPPPYSADDLSAITLGTPCAGRF